MFTDATFASAVPRGDGEVSRSLELLSLDRDETDVELGSVLDADVWRGWEGGVKVARVLPDVGTMVAVAVVVVAGVALAGEDAMNAVLGTEGECCFEVEGFEGESEEDGELNSGGGTCHMTTLSAPLELFHDFDRDSLFLRLPLESHEHS